MQSLSKPDLPADDIDHEAKGTHLLLTLKECRCDFLNDQELLARMARSAAEATHSTVLDVFSHVFEPQGISVLVVLAESHATLHTYPESRVVFWDCFTCGSRCQPELSADVLVAALNPGKVEKQVVSRG